VLHFPQLNPPGLMRKFSPAVFGAVALLLFSLTACGVQSETKASIEEQVKVVISSVFGEVKITSFLDHFPSESSLTVAYTATRPAETKDLNILTAALKAKGYKIVDSSLHGSGALIVFSDKVNFVYITFEFGKPEIDFLALPLEEAEKAMQEP